MTPERLHAIRVMQKSAVTIELLKLIDQQQAEIERLRHRLDVALRSLGDT